MTRDQLLTHFDTCVAQMRATMEAKNSDYAGAVDTDALANFNRVELLGIAQTEQGMLTRMLDKFMRLASFVKKGTLAVKDESASDTLLDLANYAILMHAQISTRKYRTEITMGEGYMAKPMNTAPVLGGV